MDGFTTTSSPIQCDVSSPIRSALQWGRGSLAMEGSSLQAGKSSVNAKAFFSTSPSQDYGLLGFARLIAMSSLYPCSYPCSTGTHNETAKKLALFFAMELYYDGMTASNLHPLVCFQFFNQIKNSIKQYTS